MRKTLTAAAMSLTILFTMGTGNAFADSNLDKVVNSVYGTPYKMGGTTVKGFDCSGFTKYVFKKMGVTLARQSKAQFKQGTSVAKSQLKEGDLVFFNTLGNGVSHVGIYVGNGKFAHASSSKGIHIDKLSNSYYQNRYVGAKRILSKYTYRLFATEL
ncbi:hydrolase [Paenibacillus sp. CAA11]|uniref:C40 family peptidase n=1 Tax=Paenibacillus sp. CAA11 TaxID=1532905 RepID=UPI000D3B4080|nr:C40 family peptidase [Paenibacillus sp. CAA11]AWB42862.1 hydrolase [Paenibacillus sp. CAA11]